MSAQTAACTAASRTMPFFTCGAAGLELRLDQRDELRAMRDQRERRRQHQFERDEAHVDGDQIRRRAEAGRGAGADVGFLQRNDLAAARAGFRAIARARHRPHRRSLAPRSQQHLGEAAGGGADIEADAAARIEAEMIERGGELHPAARDVRMRRRRAQRGIDRDLLRRLAHRRVVGGDQPGRDRGLRLGAAVEQAALDQQAIGALAGACSSLSFRHGGHPASTSEFEGKETWMPGTGRACADSLARVRASQPASPSRRRRPCPAPRTPWRRCRWRRGRPWRTSRPACPGR